MSETFVVTVHQDASESARPRNLLYLYIDRPNYSAKSLKDTLQQHLDVDLSPPPDIIVLFGTEDSSDHLATLANNPDVRRALPLYTRLLSPPPIRAIAMKQDGTWISCDDASHEFVTASAIDCLRLAGFKKICSARDVLLKGLDVLHYSKPNGDHSAQFVRSANALVRGHEIAFAALWLLKYLRTGTQNIFTDTAAIHNLIFSTVLLKLRFNSAYQPPFVDSFGSYSGLSEFNFPRDKDGLIVISASTSGGLARRIVDEKHVAPERVVTLFYLGEEPNQVGTVICDLAKNRKGWLVPCKSYRPDECEMCQNQLPLETLGGDQLLPITPTIIPKKLAEANLPSWLPDFLQDFHGAGVLQVHRIATAHDQRPQELYIDLEPLYSGNLLKGETRFMQRVDDKLAQIVPLGIRHIIYVDNQTSRSLASRIMQQIERHSHPSPSFTKHSEVPYDHESRPAFRTGGVLVVAGILVTGQRLMETNLLLRGRGDEATVYFAGLTRTTGKAALDEITSKIQFGAHGSHHYPFHSGADIYLPDLQTRRVSPWDRERATWDVLLRHRQDTRGSDDDTRAALQWIEMRRERLIAARTKGLVDDLFIPSATGSMQELRSGFAFFNQVKLKRKPSQADVYFTMAAILHSWRNQHARVGRGAGREFAAVVIAPRMFYRFSDGVIQSSILRAADKGELDYSSDESLSQAAGYIVESLLAACTDPKGEAALEILLALAERRLVLQSKHLSQCIGSATRIEVAGPLGAVMRMLATYVLSQMSERLTREVSGL